MATVPDWSNEYGVEGESRRAATEVQLWWWNAGCGLLHLFQAIAVLAASQTVTNLKAFKIPLLTVIPTWVRGFPEPALQVRGALPFVAVTSAFAFLSAFAHGVVLLGWKQYVHDLKVNQINRFRWYEYALSSSLMIALIAMLFGMWDVSGGAVGGATAPFERSSVSPPPPPTHTPFTHQIISLVLLASVNAAMCLFGMDHELLNGNRAAEHVQWEPFWFGCFAGIVPWAAIIAYLAASPSLSSVPPFVWAIIVIYFVFFNTFPLNMYLQYRRVGLFSDKRWGFQGGGYYFGERMYQVQSLVSKSLLLWLVVGGSNQPSAVTRTG
jgi:hypothetical protein